MSKYTLNIKFSVSNTRYKASISKLYFVNEARLSKKTEKTLAETHARKTIFRRFLAQSSSRTCE